MGEFEIIQQYFSNWEEPRNDVVLGIGDDAALINFPETHHLAVTTDMLISGVHFPENTSPADIAYKALAVNLSDLAAMGARPSWFTLVLSLPEANHEWLYEFSKSLADCAKFYNVSLIGGDTNKGPLSVTIQAMGQVPKDKALRRCGAKAGDWLYCTGTLGDAALGLAVLQGRREIKTKKHRDYVIERLNRPTPRLGIGLSLRQGASAAIDLSDGLMSDLGHLLEASGNLGATINLDELPMSEPFKTSLDEISAWELALSGGDDFELLFTISPDHKSLLETSLENTGSPYACMGRITGNKGIQLQSGGTNISLDWDGYDHFLPKPLSK